MTLFDDATLDAARTRGDPGADAVIAALFAEGGVTGANAVFSHLRLTGATVGGEAPPVLRDWIVANSDLPSWYDKDLARAGQELFERLGVAAVMALFNRALPMTYASRPIAKVLGSTRRLNRDAARRINETARLVLDIGTPGGFDAGGHALRSCQQVRLVHAAVRHHLRATPGAWDPADGEPLNQEDLALTLQGFSSSTLDALGTMAYDFTERESLGYMHIWRVAGVLLGVEEDLCPPDQATGLALAERIGLRHDARTDEGVAMTLALMDVQRALIPGTIVDGAVPILLRWLLGDRRSDLLGVAPMPLAGVVTGPFRWVAHLVDEVGDNSALAAKFLMTFNRALMQGVHAWYIKEQGAALRIPAQLEPGVEATGDAGPGDPP